MMIDQIEQLCGRFAAQRKVLAQKMAKLDQELSRVKRRYVTDIKHHASMVAETEADLAAAIEAAPEFFEKPKTKIIHGIKVGFRKGTGKLDWEDDAQILARLKKRFGADADDYIITTEKPSRDALKCLDEAVLGKLGVVIVDADEQVVVKPVETEIEKLVKTIMAGVHEGDAETDDAA
jgi:phage host-nuclease inhibitor protein Gam